jgi:hypothetical protein
LVGTTTVTVGTDGIGTESVSEIEIEIGGIPETGGMTSIGVVGTMKHRTGTGYHNLPEKATPFGYEVRPGRAVTVGVSAFVALLRDTTIESQTVATSSTNDGGTSDPGITGIGLTGYEIEEKPARDANQGIVEGTLDKPDTSALLSPCIAFPAFFITTHMVHDCGCKYKTRCIKFTECKRLLRQGNSCLTIITNLEPEQWGKN